MIQRTFFLVLCALFTHVPADAQVPFEMEGTVIRPGERKSFYLPVRSVDGKETTIPVTVIHGASPGPVLGLIAGIHGYEYPPIVALQSLHQMIEPSDVSGTIILVHIANVPAFLGRSVYYNPVDGKNLNRSFPGNRDGTLTDRMAWTIADKIVSRCTMMVDIHAGDASEDLHPYVGYYEYGTQTATARRMALALGFDWAILSENGPKPGMPSIYCSAEGVSRGIPTVAIEYGRLGQVTRQEGQFICDRLINMMKALGVLSGKAIEFPEPLIIRKRMSILADHTGVFVTGTTSGGKIEKGQLLGRITDFHGQLIQEIRSPVNGFIIYQLSTPPVNKGEVLFSLALEEAN